MWQCGTPQGRCTMFNFCSVTAMVTTNVDAFPSPWLAALANPPGQEVPLPEALVCDEDVWSHRTAEVHPQGDWNLLSWIICGGTARGNELAAYLLSMTSVHIGKHRLQLLDSCPFAAYIVTISHHGGIKAVIHFVLIFRDFLQCGPIVPSQINLL